MFSIPVGREVLEAITALVAVAMLFYVSFWLIARLEHKRWLEFLRARIWRAVSVGSVISLVLVGFTAVYREGFESVLFFQALISFGTGLGVWVALGRGGGRSRWPWSRGLIFRLGRKLPIKTFLNIAVVLVMATSVAFLGNAVHALQAADVIAFTRLAGWPRPADLPGTGDRLLAHGADGHRPAGARRRLPRGRASTCSSSSPARAPGRGTATDRVVRRARLIVMTPAVRVGVDVGGTFTKAVACDLDGRGHRPGGAADDARRSEGVAAGVVQAVPRSPRRSAPTGSSWSRTRRPRRSTRCSRATSARRGDRARPPARAAQGPQADRSRSRRAVARASRWRPVPEFLDVTDGLDRRAPPRARCETAGGAA